MKTLEMPYSGKVVKTKKQSKAFISAVLMPAADIIAGCSFAKNGLHQVSREQNISCSDEPGDWAEIGFRVIRTNPLDNPRLMQFNIWIHNATDTSQIPLPEAALIRTGDERDRYLGGLLLEGREEESDNEEEYDDYDFENIVIEQKDFFLDNDSYRPVKELEYVYACDGSVVWEESLTTGVPGHWKGDSYQEQMDLLHLEHSLRDEFDSLDLTLIGGVLGRLGLLAV